LKTPVSGIAFLHNPAVMYVQHHWTRQTKSAVCIRFRLSHSTSQIHVG